MLLRITNIKRNKGNRKMTKKTKQSKKQYLYIELETPINASLKDFFEKSGMSPSFIDYRKGRIEGTGSESIERSALIHDIIEASFFAGIHTGINKEKYKLKVSNKSIEELEQINKNYLLNRDNKLRDENYIG